MKTSYRRVSVCLLLTLGAFLLSSRVQAQTSSRQEFEKEIVAAFCDTFTKAAPNIKMESLNVELGMMIIPLFTKYQSQIEKEWGLSADDAEGAEAIGEKVGQLATMHCEAFQTFVKANLESILNEKTEKGSKSFSGTLTKMEGSPFTYLLVKNAQGRTDKFYWMEFFPGAEKLSTSSVSRLNKPLRIFYREMEVYKAGEKEYTPVKVITRIEFK
jgi:hypothetical protein